MVFQVKTSGKTGDDRAYTITGLIQAMRSDKPPVATDFPKLSGQATHLVVDQGATIDISGTSTVVRATGLTSCAAVCFVTQRSTTGYVYHAPSGNVSRDAFDDALSSIQATAPYQDVYIAYAHPGKADDGYKSSIDDLVGWRIPTGNIVQISEIPVANFGLNNFGQLGY